LHQYSTRYVQHYLPRAPGYQTVFRRRRGAACYALSAGLYTMAISIRPGHSDISQPILTSNKGHLTMDEIWEDRNVKTSWVVNAKGRAQHVTYRWSLRDVRSPQLFRNITWRGTLIATAVCDIASMRSAGWTTNSQMYASRLQQAVTGCRRNTRCSATLGVPVSRNREAQGLTRTRSRIDHGTPGRPCNHAPRHYNSSSPPSRKQLLPAPSLTSPLRLAKACSPPAARARSGRLPGALDHVSAGVVVHARAACRRDGLRAQCTVERLYI